MLRMQEMIFQGFRTPYYFRNGELPQQLKLNILLFHQAAAYFKMKLILVPVDEKTRKCNLRAMRRAITKNTEFW